MSSWLMAKTLVGTLIAQGVSDIVLAPGSRSAALAVALNDASQQGALRLHVRVDERVAGFLALGLAKASGRVVPVVCTSGTAVGNLLPAAMEARHSGVGWLALTCDRPAYRVGTGASQTTDQSGLFGMFAVANVRLSSSSGRPAYWSAGLRRALVAAGGGRSGRPGPAQVNVEFSNPMLPADRAEREWSPAGAAPFEATPTSHCDPVELPAVAGTVVMVGDADAVTGAEARALAEVANLPLLAEPSSNARGGPNAIATYRLLLDGDLGAAISRVITFGHPTLSRPIAALLSDARVEHIVVSRHADWFDVGATASSVVGGLTIPADDSGWLASWRSADARALVSLSDRLDTLSGHTLAFAVVASAEPGDNLVFGSSNPIRDADIAPLGRGAIAWANRGLAGIDGTIATAQGIALATRRPTTLLLGDLTFQHDVGSLALPPGEASPDLRIVVANDDGGSIFHTLEQGAPAFEDAFERVFATPQSLDLAAIASAFGWRTTGVSTREGLARALSRPVAGPEVIIAAIPRHDRRATDKALRDWALVDPADAQASAG